MRYIRDLDGVRGLAVLLVILFHYNFLLEIGWIGVQLFFVLSGYLITTILLEDKQQTLPTYLKGFYWRRSLRIFPIYYLYLFAVGILYILFREPSNYALTAPYLFTYTYNLHPLFAGFELDRFFIHFWSLSIEEQFYLIWPLIVYFLTIRQLKIVLIITIIVAPLIRFLLAQYLLGYTDTPTDHIGQIVYRFTLSQWDGFAFGAIIPVFGFSKHTGKLSRYFFPALLLMIGIGVINYLSVEERMSLGATSLGYPIGSLLNYQHVWSYSIIGIISFLLILNVLNGKSKVMRILFGNTIMIFLGKLSYGLYIYHWIIWMIFGKYMRDYFESLPILGFAVYCSICLIVAYISYIVIEKPLLSLKDKYFIRKPMAV